MNVVAGGFVISMQPPPSLSRINYPQEALAERKRVMESDLKRYRQKKEGCVRFGNNLIERLGWAQSSWIAIRIFVLGNPESYIRIITVLVLYLEENIPTMKAS